jgi:dTDP-4-dehydrorhamnose 3,5-epimerase
MKVIETELPGVVVFEPKVFSDQRGFFVETFRETTLRAAGINETFVQDNHSRSSKGILRGLHYQLVQPQGKLVRVSRGKVFDVAVDVRKGSPTFGQWFGTVLDDESLRMMYVPPGMHMGLLSCQKWLTSFIGVPTIIMQNQSNALLGMILTSASRGLSAMFHSRQKINLPPIFHNNQQKSCQATQTKVLNRT